jgi:putative holliday junction resolvase
VGITTDVDSFQADLPPFGRLIGLDVGTKTLGVAVCDAGRMIASPDETLRRGKFTLDAQALAKKAKDLRVTGLVIGLPLNMDGSDSPRTQSVRAFARNIVQHLPLPVLLWDERWSTAAVTRVLLEADASRARRAELVDKLAASYILQGALDAMSLRPPRQETE